MQDSTEVRLQKLEHDVQELKELLGSLNDAFITYTDSRAMKGSKQLAS